MDPTGRIILLGRGTLGRFVKVGASGPFTLSEALCSLKNPVVGLSCDDGPPWP